MTKSALFTEYKKVRLLYDDPYFRRAYEAYLIARRHIHIRAAARAYLAHENKLNAKAPR